LREQAINPYPHKFSRTHRIDTFRQEFETEITEVGFLEDRTVSVTGRIKSIRGQGAKLIFIDLEGDGAKIQVMAQAQFYGGDQADFDALAATLRRGDIIGVEGVPGRTKTQELSIRPVKIMSLSYCLHQIPKSEGKENPLTMDTRYRQRYLDLICNQNTHSIFRTRAKILEFTRSFLGQHDFVEVETPMMNMVPGGATARPFVTYHNDLKLDLYMRVAPELYLKMLIVGGMDRVFEIGKNFRNEGLDMTHNPEFTACEFYWAYADYNDLMTFTEKMLSEMVKSIKGSYKIQYSTRDEKGNATGSYEIDFTPPFRRVSMLDGLEEKLGIQIPRGKDLETEETREFLHKICMEHAPDIKPPFTAARMIDKLVGEFIEVDCVNPTFIIDHPQLMSPLAKWHREQPGLTERFELFINKHEVINAYTELNDPKVQMEAFMKQADAKAQGDDEAQGVDHAFVTALEYGLPPTAGWGMGIDRLTMLLSDTNNIKEVILFPAMKPNEDRTGGEGQGASAAAAATEGAEGAEGAK